MSSLSTEALDPKIFDVRNTGSYDCKVLCYPIQTSGIPIGILYIQYSKKLLSA